MHADDGDCAAVAVICLLNVRNHGIAVRVSERGLDARLTAKFSADGRLLSACMCMAPNFSLCKRHLCKGGCASQAKLLPHQVLKGEALDRFLKEHDLVSLPHGVI